MVQHKAYGLLAEQPLSAAEVTFEQRRKIVISAVVRDDGTTEVLSFYGDLKWKLWPFIKVSNASTNEKTIDWACIPEQFREVCKAVVYRYWMVGIPGWKPPGVKFLRTLVQNLSVFTRYLEGCTNIHSMADVHPIHIANYVHEQKSTKRLKPSSLNLLFIAIESLYRFADQHPDGLSFHPWPESSAKIIAGNVGHAQKQTRKSGKTPLISKNVAQMLFNFAEDFIQRADVILDERDAGQRSTYNETEVTLIRNACFFLLGVLTGMRCEELVGIEVGAGRTEIKDGITFNWVASVEHKTGKGRVEYLMPSMGHEILRVLERWSAPFRQRLREQLAEWNANTSDEGMQDRLEWINDAQGSLNRLFLGRGTCGRIGAVSGVAWHHAMQKFAKKAGTDWKLAPHQMRRLYAWTFVRHRLGNMLFLKEQLKHSSLDMTILYAANPLQDAALYDEILEELRSQKNNIIQGWLFDDQPLTGGGGKKIMKLRAHDFPNRASLIEETSDKLNIRSTGHGWCLAQDEGCGGICLYEVTNCVECGTSVIDGSFKPIWLEIYHHQLELLDEVQDLGQGAVKRAYRDLAKARKVLKDIGVDIEGESGDYSAPN